MAVVTDLPRGSGWSMVLGDDHAVELKNLNRVRTSSGHVEAADVLVCGRELLAAPTSMD